MLRGLTPQPQRSSTGEALADGIPKRRVKWFAWKRRIFYPGIQKYRTPRYLHDKIAALPAEETTPRLGQFHDALSKNIDSERILERCVWVSTISGRTCAFNNERSIAHNLDIVQEELSRSTASQILTLCAINTDVGSDIEPYVPWYTSITKSRATHLPTTISPAAHFRALLQIVLKNNWPDHDHAKANLLRQLEDRSSPQLSVDINLPSKARSPVPASSKQQEFDITLEWMREQSAFETFLGSYDWAIYISEPYSERPKLDVLRLKDVTPSGSKHHRMVMITNSGSALKSLKSEHDKAFDNGLIDPSSSAEDQMLDSLVISAGFIIADITHYVRKSVELVHKVDLAARSSPSLSKVQFLLHLSERHDWTAQACRKNANEISDLFNRYHYPPFLLTERVYGKLQSSSGQIDDLTYLASKLDEHAGHISRLRGVIADQIDLFDKRRNRTIGMFIAIYVPLAFATSFFGMNIEDSNARYESWTNTSSFDIDSTALLAYPWYDYDTEWRFNRSYLRNAGERVLGEDISTFLTADSPVSRSATWSTSDQKANYNWPLWMFGAVAGALTFGSIILPLTAGHVYRSIARFSLRKRRTFRSIVSLLWTLVLIISIEYVWIRGDSTAVLYTITVTSHIVDAVGIALGLYALRISYAHKAVGQAVAWLLWCCVCYVDLISLWADMFDTEAGVYVSYAVPRMGWVWVLFNWTFARKGFSWTFYPATLEGKP